MSTRRIKQVNLLTSKQKELLKQQLTAEAIDAAFLLMLGIPVMVLHDKYNQLIRKEVEGKGRTERFADMCLDLYDSYARGYLTIEDIHKVLWEEAGVKIVKEGK